MSKIYESVKAILPYKFFYFIKYWLLFWKYGGFRFQCPICGYSFRQLRSGGAHGEGRQAHCPVCWSLERQRLHYLFFKQKTSLFSANLKLLHIAPEASFSDLFSSQKNLSYLSVDLHSSTAMKKWDITQMPAKDEEFDVVLCFHVLEHIPDDRKAMSEIYRVLKKGGWAILDVPVTDREKTYEDPSITDPKEREKAFGQWDHVRIYGKDYIDRLKAVGFKVRMDPFINEFSERDISKYNLSHGQNIFYCTKD